ncbi:HpcH/HpaI aldolase/citrate lyase family protein [Deinococcus peraridilitoris]|uniref:Citrate lyase beta subunit n=1 Tax=Deinococcus peraridilitoris (strain DSM 19664 / LMG 22246 / CIP 109416 / KR-200) TaxID=937777 RepID=L0A4I8_DEIPD|nr:CoA ester lyase [Deinococcus peraridilitoris]AFZ67940.1 citrate lyase beta subunit [Deinococcus peraridilitoris DSM 19664]
MPLRRSALYVPGDKPRALEKARALNADLLILDLEDAVAPEYKVAAREQVREALRQGFPRDREVLVRLNALSTLWGDDDLQMLLGAAPHGIVLPKAEDPAEVRSLNLGIPLWLTIETPRGVLRLEELAAVRGVAGLVMGTSDLVRELRARHTPGREGLLFALSKTVTCARAFGLTVLDGVYLDFRDQEGFARACAQGRDLGFDGKTVIHPGQLETVNRVFAPSAGEVQRAREVLSAWQDARAEGKSVAVYAGQLIEQLHVSEAQEVLRLAAEVAARGVHERDSSEQF